MTQNETLLWSRLNSFELDQKDDQLTFSKRLARENGWTISYTLRVMEEYKKFLFLCCTSSSPVTPSDPVDQAWHLHLTYTKSYWEDLCKNTLEREIHHNPTKGGEAEQQKFDTLYTGLHEIYLEKFGTAPPADIWHDNQKRFSDINFQRINRKDNWIVPKLNVHTLITVAIAVAISGFSISTGSTSVIFIGIFIALLILSRALTANGKSKRDGNQHLADSGTAFWSADISSWWDSGCSSHHSDSGCSSHGDSGCRSGCSGCGGGCGGD